MDSSGTGLGLAIVAALVKAHGGTVEVTRRRAAARPFGSASAGAPHVGDEIGDADESDGHRENDANGRRAEQPGYRNGDQPEDRPERAGDDRGETATNVADDSTALPKK